MNGNRLSDYDSSMPIVDTTDHDNNVSSWTLKFI